MRPSRTRWQRRAVVQAAHDAGQDRRRRGAARAPRRQRRACALRRHRDRPRRHERLPGLAVWATLSTSGLEQVQLPAQAKRIIILADHDASGAGLRAAETTARRLRAEGREVAIALPPAGRRRLQRSAAARWTGGRARRARTRAAGAPMEEAPPAIGQHRPLNYLAAERHRCRCCAPTRAISPVRSSGPGACCSPPTARPGCSATPAFRPGWCRTTKAARSPSR